MPPHCTSGPFYLRGPNPVLLGVQTRAQWGCALLPTGQAPPLAVLEHADGPRRGLWCQITRAFGGLTNYPPCSLQFSPPVGTSGAGEGEGDRLTPKTSKGRTLELRSFQRAGKPWDKGGAFLLVPKPDGDGQARGQALFEASKGQSCPRGQHACTAPFHLSLRHEKQISAQGQARPDGDS